MRLYVPLLKRQGMTVSGCPRYIGAHVKFDDFEKISIGDRAVISDESILLTHDYSFTTALIAIGKKPNKDVALIREIVIGDNVFIGKRSVVMPGSRIGNNCIVGAGCVVRGVIPADSVLIGNPGKVIGSVQEQADKWSKFLDSDKIRIDK